MELTNYFKIHEIIVIAGALSILTVSIGRTFGLEQEYEKTFSLGTALFSKFTLYSFIMMEINLLMDSTINYVNNILLPMVIERLNEVRLEGQPIEHNEADIDQKIREQCEKYFKAVFKSLYLDLVVAYSCMIWILVTVVQINIYHHTMNYLIVGR